MTSPSFFTWVLIAGMATIGVSACREARESPRNTASQIAEGSAMLPDSGGIDLDGLTAEKKDSLKQKLADAGLYACCVEPGCDRCLEEHGRCNCYHAIKKKDPICGQCYDGYRKGRGKLKTVNLNELKRM